MLRKLHEPESGYAVVRYSRFEITLRTANPALAPSLARCIVLRVLPDS